MDGSSGARPRSSSCSLLGYPNNTDGSSDDEACFGRKRRRVVKKDLLSSLPKSMIRHIFSFMPIEDIVRTSVLSKRWRTMWYKTPAVSFSCPYVLSSFRDFHPNIDGVLMFCTSLTIQKFYVHRMWYHPEMNERLDVWLRFAVARRAEDIHLGLCVYVDTDHPYEEGARFYYDLPSALLKCQSVVKLHLSRCDLFPVSYQNRCINWTSLKVLHIGDSKVRDDVFDKILNASPLLEYLGLRDCRGMRHLRINSRKLKELVIDGYMILMYYYSDSKDKDRKEVVISAPHLQVLRLLGSWVGIRMVNLNDVSSLVECEMNFELKTSKSNETVVRDMLRRLFGNLSSVNKLVLGRWLLQVIPRFQSEDSYFLLDCRNLVLRTAADEWELAGIAEMLKCTLFLEKLVIDLLTDELSRDRLLLVDDVDFYEGRFGRLREMKAIGLLNRLKRVEIFGFEVYSRKVESWLSLINVLLTDTQMLEEMTINVVMCLFNDYVNSTIEEVHVLEILDVARKVMRYQRGSSSCQVVFNYPFMKESSRATPR